MPSERKGHFCVLSGPFEVLANVDSGPNYDSKFHAHDIVLEASGPDRDELFAHELISIAYGPANEALKPGFIYTFRGRLVAPNTPQATRWIFPVPNCGLCIAPAETFKEAIADKVSVSGLGIVIECYTTFEESAQPTDPRSKKPKDPNSTVVVVKHCDFHAETKERHSFDVEYRCRPRLHLVGTHKLLHRGSETIIHGHLIGFDTKKHRFIVDIDYVAIPSGHDKVIPSDATVTPGGRVKASSLMRADSSLTIGESSSPIKDNTTLTNASVDDFSINTEEVFPPPPKKRGRPPAASASSKRARGRKARDVDTQNLEKSDDEIEFQ